MYMPYTNNPNLPRVRMQAIELVQQGKSVREAARHFGFSHNAVLNWLKRAPEYGWHNQLVIPTRSSRPNHHPKELPMEIVSRILTLRAERNQCAEIIHHRLKQEGIRVSISSVKRIFRRLGISKYSQWKKWHQYPPRPVPERPGFLVEIDSVHEGIPSDRLSAYALIDVHARWACAMPALRVNSRITLEFLRQAKKQSPFSFQTIQTDHGGEFSKWFTKMAECRGVSHRHSRARTPTDNGHIERFIRTLQDECLHRISRNFRIWQKEIPEYLRYYNQERPHMGLNFKTPNEIIKWSQAID